MSDPVDSFRGASKVSSVAFSILMVYGVVDAEVVLTHHYFKVGPG